MRTFKKKKVTSKLGEKEWGTIAVVMGGVEGMNRFKIHPVCDILLQLINITKYVV